MTTIRDDNSGSNSAGHAAGSDARGGGGRYLGREITIVSATVTERDLDRFGVVILEDKRLDTLGLRILRLRSIPPNDDGVTIEALRRRFPDADISRNHLYRPGRLDRDEASLPLAGAWHRRILNWSEAAAACARGRAIGIIDTSLVAGSADLDGIALETKAVTDDGFAPSTDPHGSYVVSLVAGPNIGVVPGARVFHAAAVETVGQETYASATSIATAIDWLVSREVAVINMSLAGPDNPLLYRAIRIAAARGTILVAPVGNGGPGTETAYPAAYPEVVAITATDRLNRVWRHSSNVVPPAIAAPGAGLRLGPTTISGTSFASPLAAGALLTALAGPETSTEIKDQILARARTTDRTGIGLLQFDPACFRD